jgi:hypothetical protein
LRSAACNSSALLLGLWGELLGQGLGVPYGGLLGATGGRDYGGADGYVVPAGAPGLDWALNQATLG